MESNDQHFKQCGGPIWLAMQFMILHQLQLAFERPTYVLTISANNSSELNTISFESRLTL